MRKDLQLLSYAVIAIVLLSTCEPVAKTASNQTAAYCTYSVDKTDEFTKKREVQTQYRLIFNSKVTSAMGGSVRVMFYVRAQYLDGKKRIIINKYVPSDARSEDRFNFPYLVSDPNPNTKILLSDGEVVTLVPYYSTPDLNVENGWLTQDIRFEPDETAWLKLKNTSTKKIRIRYQVGNSIYEKDFEVPQNYMGEISRVIKCIDTLNISSTH